MRHYERSALLPYSTEQIFAIVADVPKYCEFLPWCSASRVLAQNGADVVGELELSVSGIRQTFRTQNILLPHKNIRMSLVEGPFAHLQGEWNFQQLGSEGCRVSMSLEFEFSNRLVEKTFGRVFSAAADKLVASFSQRADELYG